MDSRNPSHSKSDDSASMLSSSTTKSTTQLLKSMLVPKYHATAKASDQRSASQKQSERKAAKISPETLATYAALK
ncbi:hypothetical protein LTR09_002576 [Extremus antarcticus]|uniref:Uncharacterized protein n=1 Tax=Extremus antarcticus TaxID=702011 RepID=A0AAJ0LV80_9PEZI|nr:hypothetical protein LTR09_002576 [Extremus antarcticus]